jgi:isoprenylcysteine carboxyl methyltransferase (ICMT) family protein YpbQ
MNNSEMQYQLSKCKYFQLVADDCEREILKGGKFSYISPNVSTLANLHSISFLSLILVLMANECADNYDKMCTLFNVSGGIIIVLIWTNEMKSDAMCAGVKWIKSDCSITWLVG